MRTTLVILVLGALLWSCNGSDQPEKPENLIPKKKMESVLYDLYVINAAKGVNRKLMEKNGIVPETYILTKHKIDSTQFADSNSYYAYDPDSYRVMVENVKKRLEKDKKKYESLEKKEGKAAKRRRDTIKRMNTKNKDSIVKSLKKKVKN